MGRASVVWNGGSKVRLKVRNKKQAFAAQECLQKARELLLRRRKYRAPLTIAPPALYNALIGVEQEKAINTLLLYGLIEFKLSSSFTVKFEIPWPGRNSLGGPDEMTCKCNIRLEVAMPKLEIYIPRHHQVYEEMAAWARHWREAHEESTLALNTLSYVLDACRTPAELLRLWPAMGKFFYPHVKRPALMRTRMKVLSSKINAHEELQRVMRNTEELIAESLLLPDNDEQKELAYID